VAGPVLVELMGPPGAGKSSVLRALEAADASVAPMPILRHPPYRLVLARHLAATALGVARRRATNGVWDRNILVMTAYLRALPEVFAGSRRPPHEVIVLDQGPLYTLTREPLLQPRLRDLADAELRRWAGLLDVVVWLDAPDAVLAERIDERGWEHRYKGAGPEAVAAGLAGDRAVYESILARLAPIAHGPPVLRFDTSRQTPEAVATAVLAAGRAR
jgi:broad-specificity NMP kinase